jgi:hypothetical protein
MFLLRILFVVGVGTSYNWDSSILQIPPWPVSDCAPQNSTNCMDQISQSSPCNWTTVCTKEACSIKVAVILPNTTFYIVSLQQVGHSIKEY